MLHSRQASDQPARVLVSLHLYSKDLLAPGWREHELLSGLTSQSHWVQHVENVSPHSTCSWVDVSLEYKPLLSNAGDGADRMHPGAPRRRPTATLTMSLSIRRPKDDTGKALNQAQCRFPGGHCEQAWMLLILILPASSDSLRGAGNHVLLNKMTVPHSIKEQDEL